MGDWLACFRSPTFTTSAARSLSVASSSRSTASMASRSASSSASDLSLDLDISDARPPMETRAANPLKRFGQY